MIEQMCLQQAKMEIAKGLIQKMKVFEDFQGKEKRKKRVYFPFFNTISKSIFEIGIFNDTTRIFA